MSQSMEISWINNAKVICLMLVYMYHSSVYSGFETDTLYSFYSPFFTCAFFFISGYLIFWKQLNPQLLSVRSLQWLVGGGKKMIQNIICKVAIPTILFSMVNYLPKVLLRGEGIDLWSFFRDTFLGGSLWFTCSLAVAELLIFILLLTRIGSIYFYVICTIGIATVGIFLSKNGITIWGDRNCPWFYKTGMIATLYISIGGLFAKVEKYLDKKLNGNRWMLIILVYSILITIMQGKVKVSLNVGILNGFGLMMSIIGILMIVLICKHIKESQSMSWIGRHTLGLYFLSGGIPNVLSLAYLRFIGEVTFISYLFISFISMLIAVYAVVIIDKYTPFVFDIRKINYLR